MNRDLEIWVFGDHRHHPKDRSTLQILSHARALSGKRGRVTALILGHEVEEVAVAYIAYGAQRVLLVDHPKLALYEADLFAMIMSDLIKEHKPDILLAGASQFGRELAARIAKRIRVGLGADCVSLDWDEKKETLIGFSPAFGGNFLARIVWSSSRPHVATLNPGTIPERPFDKAAHGEIVRVEKSLDHVPSRVKVISSVREPHQTGRLEDARVVVVGGRGVKNLQGFNSIRELALLLGGEVGATRPAVDAHWTSHEQLIGQTGKSIKPALLITCGTSGAIQYTAALGGSGTTVAINRDPRAPIFKVADFGIVADALSFLPAFIGEVKGHLFREITDLYRVQVKTGRGRMPVSFGQRIKKLREDRKMSVADLAERTGQPPEFIEQVESDSLTPPVSFLLQLSNALQMDPSNFLTEQEKVQIDEKRQEGFVKRTQNYSYRTLTPGAEDKHLRSFMVTIEPKEKHKMVEYKHPGEEFIFVYNGELELTLGNKVIILKRGETIHFDSETKHKLRNMSDEKCELIVTLYTP
ncbi:MAG TPA: FAD-binding protein [Thermodesulfobacteriota bacterium]|nr:FAD-binding protein [Thermodesulfobacteriota bacterium]